MIGAVGGGWLADRFHITWVLFSMYVLAAVSITLLGYKMPTQALFIVAIPAVIAAAAVALINHRLSASAHHEDVSAEIPDSGLVGAEPALARK